MVMKVLVITGSPHRKGTTYPKKAFELGMHIKEID